jgi:rsbT co-antagonist protein RsbR
MQKRLQGWLGDIPMRTPLERRQAGLLQIFLLIIIVGCLIGLPITFVTVRGIGSLLTIIIYALMIVLTGSALFLLRRGRFTLAVKLAVVGQIAALGFVVLAIGFQNSPAVLAAFAVPTALAGLALGRNGTLLAAGLSSGFVAATGLLKAFSPTLVDFLPVAAVSPLTITASFILIITVLSLFLDRFGSMLREALTDATTHGQELERLRIGLEDTVAERTAALQLALQDVEQREARLSQTLADLHASETTIRELGAPVIPVLPGVLVAPLIGVLDGDRAATLADNVLAMVEREGARQVIFDVTGVPLVDTQVAQVLLQTAAAVRLLGGQSLLVGIRPEVAQTIIALGLDLAAITTYPNLQEAVAAILGTRTGYELKDFALVQRLEIKEQ